MTRVCVGGYAGLAVGEFADRLTGLGPAVPEGAVERPSYVVVSRDRRWAYAVSEVSEGKVVAVPLRGEGPISRARSGGADPCHLALSPGGHLLVVSNYSSGTVGLLAAASGTLMLLDTVHLTGHGPHQRQRGPHPHQATWLSETEVVVCDLGSDTLVGLTLSEPGAGGGTPRLTQRWSVHLPAGTGPRHLVASRDRGRLWVVGELDATVHQLHRDQGGVSRAGSGGWSLVRTLPLLPGGADGSLAAGIVLDPGGAHLYVTVRGADVLIHYAVGSGGELTEVGRHPTAHWPRFVGWLPGNRALVVVAERADRLQCFPVGPDGVPGAVAWTADWPEPTCLTR